MPVTNSLVKDLAWRNKNQFVTRNFVFVPLSWKLTSESLSLISGECSDMLIRSLWKRQDHMTSCKLFTVHSRFTLAWVSAHSGVASPTFPAHYRLGIERGRDFVCVFGLTTKRPSLWGRRQDMCMYRGGLHLETDQVVKSKKAEVHSDVVCKHH